jgi:L-threonylcarbamoyladenylate synthase
MIRLFSSANVDAAAGVLRAGGVLAYPTEAVFGLGCDPSDEDAVTRLYRLKKRDPAQGFLLVAATEAQLDPFVEWSAVPPTQLAEVRSTWPGPITWVFPRRPPAPPAVVGAHPGIAVRVSSHPGTVALCRSFGGAIVSTSANVHGCYPAKSVTEVQRRFAGSSLDGILCAPLGGLAMPTEIRDATSGAVVRAGGPTSCKERA